MSATAGSLYIAGFAQAGPAPHVGLLVATSGDAGTLVHIRIDRATSPYWQYQARPQRMAGEMAFTSLLRIHASPTMSVEQLCAVAEGVDVPCNDRFGECAPWVWRVVRALHDKGLVNVKISDGDEDLDKGLAALEEEFAAFAAGNRAFATRAKFPNVAVSSFCE